VHAAERGVVRERAVAQGQARGTGHTLADAFVADYFRRLEKLRHLLAGQRWRGYGLGLATSRHAAGRDDGERQNGGEQSIRCHQGSSGMAARKLLLALPVSAL